MSDNNSPWQQPTPEAVETPFQLLQRWEVAKLAAAQAVELERSLRNKATAAFFPSPDKGTQRYDLGNNYKLKLVYGIAYNLDQDKINDTLDAIESLGPDGKFLADRLVKVKYDLFISEYEKLDLSNATHVKIKALIDTVLTTKPKAPVLEIEAPKVS